MFLIVLNFQGNGNVLEMREDRGTEKSICWFRLSRNGFRSSVLVIIRSNNFHNKIFYD